MGVEGSGTAAEEGGSTSRLHRLGYEVGLPRIPEVLGARIKFLADGLAEGKWLGGDLNEAKARLREARADLKKGRG